MSFFGMGPTEVLIILLIAIILFGSKKIPELARSLGQALREFKRASSGLLEEEEVREVPKEDEKFKKIVHEVAEKLEINTEGKDVKDVIKEIIEKAKEKGIYDEAVKKLEEKSE